MQMQFAEIATEIEAARLLTYNAARLKEEGHSFTKQAAMAKWYASVVAQKASGSAIEWAGGVGFTRYVLAYVGRWDERKSDCRTGVLGRPESRNTGVIPRSELSTRELQTFSLLRELRVPVASRSSILVDIRRRLGSIGKFITKEFS